MADQDSAISIKIEGIEKLVKAFNKFPHEIERTMSAAGEEASNEILDEQGLRKYPPATPANSPPTPYYVRGKGTQYASYNKLNSEKLGTQWAIESKGFRTKISNRASYAKWVHGDEQARAMERIGWKKLFDVAKGKRHEITKIYQGWVNRLIKKLDL